MANDTVRYRAAEAALWSSFDVAPSEEWVRLTTGEDVRVQILGDGPPVLFVHGGSAAGANWAPLVARLGDFRCLVVDRPGCGLSDPIAGGRKLLAGELEAFADGFVADLVDGLGIDRVHLVPTSMGGYFALRGAAAHPERVDRIVGVAWLMGAMVGSLPISMRIATVPGLGQLMTRLPPPRFAVVRILRQLGLGPALDAGLVGDEFVDWFLALLRDTDSMRNELRAVPSIVTPIKGMNEQTLIPPEVLGRIEAPTLLLWSADDPIGGADVARVFAEHLPDATLELLPDGGHAPWVSHADRCADSVRSFLRPAA